LRRSGDYFYTSQDISLAYQWTERFSTLTRYALTSVLYDESGTGEFEDRIEQYIGQEFRYLVRPETTALAGATTESLRNIELVKSLGLAQQEEARLTTVTGKILGLELKKVRYLRSLSFIQGTSVNALRTSILFLMLYLIYDRQITVGQFFSLWDLLVLHLWTSQELRKRHQHLPGSGVSLNVRTSWPRPRAKPKDPVHSPSAIAFEDVGFHAS
jgi:ATP-binding cassette subfamily B protein